MKFKYFILFVLLFWLFKAKAQVLTLDSCRALALKNSEELKIQLNESTKYEVNSMAIKASQLPSLNGSVLGFNVGNPLNNFLPQYGMLTTMTISQSLYMGGYYDNAFKQNRIAAEMSSYMDTIAMQNVIVNVDRLFWSLVNAIEKKKVVSNSFVTISKLEKEVETSWQAGLIDRNELLKIQVGKTNAEIQLL